MTIYLKACPSSNLILDFLKFIYLNLVFLSFEIWKKNYVFENFNSNVIKFDAYIDKTSFKDINYSLVEKYILKKVLKS